MNAVSRKIEKKQNFMMIEDYYLMLRIIRCRAKQTTDSPKYYRVTDDCPVVCTQHLKLYFSAFLYYIAFYNLQPDCTLKVTITNEKLIY